MSRERRFELDGLTLAAQEWGQPGQAPLLALHGWLDNSASFAALAPHLEGRHLVALDLAGHGRSDHRPGTGPYPIWEDVGELFAVADQLGWEEFDLLGHSRGGIIGMLAAGAFPARVRRLALIEALWPEPPRETEAPGQLARSIVETRRLARRPLTRYADIDRATQARERGLFPLGRGAARALTERGTRPVVGGYEWSSDPRLFAPSAVKFTEAQLHAFLQAASAEMGLILGEQGIPQLFKHYRRALRGFPERLQTVTLPGGHHLHMDEAVLEVAQCVRHFLSDRGLATANPQKGDD